VVLQINQHFLKHEANIIYTLLKINVSIPTIVLRLKKNKEEKQFLPFEAMIKNNTAQHSPDQPYGKNMWLL